MHSSQNPVGNNQLGRIEEYRGYEDRYLALALLPRKTMGRRTQYPIIHRDICGGHLHDHVKGDVGSLPLSSALGNECLRRWAGYRLFGVRSFAAAVELDEYHDR